MTEQELQDKAKDLAKNVPLRTDTPYPEMVRYFFASMYLRGYDDGKNDTAEWHYPSRGEYPPEELYVLCKLLDDTYEVGKYCPSKYKEYQEYESPWDFGDYLEDYIDCWQYIVPT